MESGQWLEEALAFRQEWRAQCSDGLHKRNTHRDHYKIKYNVSRARDDSGERDRDKATTNVQENANYPLARRGVVQCPSCQTLVPQQRTDHPSM